jgi:glucose-1-phosphate cytidylyltransferase
MKVVILAGGFGTRLSEETQLKPKPMIEIGDNPILWHIMKIYSSFGFNEFIICLGYKGYVIKEYFANYLLHESDVTINIRENKITTHDSAAEPWSVTLVNTGQNSMTGGRIKRIKDFVGDEPFFLTYGDGVCDVNVKELLAFHQTNNKLVTVTAVQPSGRFGTMDISGDASVHSFAEKPKGEQGWINGGFFVCQPEVFDMIEGDHTTWEKEPMEQLASMGEMAAYKHEGFWQCMDTLRDKNFLESEWASANCKWRLWN